ncbi:MAG: STN domain-containing protein [Flavobacteriales bacterium]|nr:STN domain-containing protein [Flavobacteriales bacterium]
MNRGLLTFFISVLIFVCSITGLVAQESILDKTIDLRVENKSVQEVLVEMAKIAKTSLSIKSSLIPSSEKTSINVHNATIREVLKELLSNYNINFRYVGNTIAIYKPKSYQSIFKEDYIPIAEREIPPPPSLQPLLTKISPTEKPRPPSITKDSSSTIEEHIVDNEEPHLPLDTANLKKNKIAPEPKIIAPSSIANQDLIQQDTTITIDKNKDRYFSFNLSASYLMPTLSSASSSIMDVDFEQTVDPSYLSNLNITYHMPKFGVGLGIQTMKYNSTISSQYYLDTTYTTKEFEVHSSYIGGIAPDTIRVYIGDSIDVEVRDSNLVNNQINAPKQILLLPISLVFPIVQNKIIAIKFSFQITPAFVFHTGQYIDSRGAVATKEKSTELLWFTSNKIFINYLINSQLEISTELGYSTMLNQLENQTHYPLQSSNYLKFGIGITYNLR